MAMTRSLKLSPNGKRQVELALTGKAWSTEDLAAAINVGRATATTFRAGNKGVDRQNFVKFCQVLGLDWQKVVAPDSLLRTNSAVVDTYFAGSTTAENLQQNLNETQGIQLQEKTSIKSTESLDEEEVEKIRVHCREKILSQYSKIRLLSGQEIGVDQLYVDVWLLNRSPRTFMVSQNKMLETFDLRNDRLGLGDRIQRNPGFDVANKESKLLILGKPGAGKTTFLKHLAVDWCNGKFQSGLIAVFIEFRQIRDEGWNLLDAIGEELEIQQEKHIKDLLKDGKLLVLMDGFDEVSTQELRAQVQQQLGEVAKYYSKSHYIMTCRTQIMQGIPSGFTSVEVADFNVSQVQAFVHNWFQADGQDEATVKNQWATFAQTIAKNLALKELTVTPVLLGLMCLVLQDEREIPAQSSMLYERGIKLLLRKWNDDKAINDWKIGTETYQRLTVEQKEHLLIEIAARKFENPGNFVLFEQEDISRQISGYLNLQNLEDARAVLKAIESQHGLLVERADELWSFSHLTFQEYFTTKWLLSLSSEDLSQKIASEQWQKIVQQLLKAQGQSDRLLRLIKQAIDYSVFDDGKLQEFLIWVKKKAISTNNLCEANTFGSFYFSIVRELDLALDFARDGILVRSQSIEKDLDRARVRVLDMALIRVLDRAIDFDVDFRTRSLDRIRTCVLDLADTLEFACYLAIALTNTVELVNRLQQVKAKLLDGAEINNFEEWWKAHGQYWIEELRQIMVEYLNIGHDWRFTDYQKEKLQRYHYANRFLVELLKIKNAVSPEVRQEIEDNLLLPIEELKRRLPDLYN
jgi:predicted NACHT family NTPase